MDPLTGHTVLKASQACMDAIQEPACGHGVYIVSKKEIFVGEKSIHLLGGKPWSQLMKESVYLPATESYGPLAQYIINSCEKNNCDAQVDRFKIVLPQIDALTKASH